MGEGEKELRLHKLTPYPFTLKLQYLAAAFHTLRGIKEKKKNQSFGPSWPLMENENQIFLRIGWLISNPKLLMMMVKISVLLSLCVWFMLFVHESGWWIEILKVPTLWLTGVVSREMDDLRIWPGLICLRHTRWLFWVQEFGGLYSHGWDSRIVQCCFK